MSKISYRISNIANPGITGFFCGAYSEEENIGYAIISEAGAKKYLLSKIFVYEPFRNKGIGTSIIESIVLYLKDIQAEILQINYGKDIILDKFEKFLSKSTWSPAELMCTFYRIDTKKAIGTFINKYFVDKPIPNIRVKFYNQLNEEEKKRITQYADLNVSDFSNPLRDNSCIVPELSLFAFDQNGDIAGWIVVEDLRKGELSFTLSYVAEKHRSNGLGLKLQFEIFRQAKELRLIEKYKYITFESFKEDIRNSKMYDLIFNESIVSKYPCYRRTMLL